MPLSEFDSYPRDLWEESDPQLAQVHKVLLMGGKPGLYSRPLPVCG